MSFLETTLCCGSLVLQRSKDLFVFLRNSLMLWVSLLLQRRKDLMSSTNGLIFSVVIMLRIFYGVLLLALCNYSGHLAPRLSLYNGSFHSVSCVFWMCSLQLLCTPCAW